MTVQRPATFHKQLCLGKQQWRGSITLAPFGGWEVREQLDNRVLQQISLSDWHRVERALTGLSLKAAALEATGWTESPSQGAAPRTMRAAN